MRGLVSFAIAFVVLLLVLPFQAAEAQGLAARFSTNRRAIQELRADAIAAREADVALLRQTQPLAFSAPVHVRQSAAFVTPHVAAFSAPVVVQQFAVPVQPLLVQPQAFTLPQTFTLPVQAYALPTQPLFVQPQAFVAPQAFSLPCPF